MVDILTTTFGLRSHIPDTTTTVEMIMGVFDPNISYMPLNYVWLEMLDEPPSWVSSDYSLMETYYSLESLQVASQRTVTQALKADFERWATVWSGPNNYNLPPPLQLVGMSYRKIDPEVFTRI